MKTADLLADIGAIDAHLLSLPLEELEQMEFYVGEREKLLRLLGALEAENREAASENLANLRVVGDETRQLHSKLRLTRERVLQEMQDADRRLKQLNGLGRQSGGEKSGSARLGRLLSLVG
jgi:hypothetical protein